MGATATLGGLTRAELAAGRLLATGAALWLRSGPATAMLIGGIFGSSVRTTAETGDGVAALGRTSVARSEGGDPVGGGNAMSSMGSSMPGLRAIASERGR